ncbi:hypothetical protein GQ44DRAFT_706574 [Phaeosphaeriaceae sp. PMI808]|nr:hypothetical protein GQ44DRAFT_706574 [Phaeosphaeriaceae sp. PMI808]
MTLQSESSMEWMQSCKENPTRIGFLDLPRELRDFIYSSAFRVQGAIFIYSPNPYSLRPTTKAMIVRHGNEGPVEPQHLGNSIPLSMMRACRQLHAECSPVLYGGNVFRVWLLSDTADLAMRYRELVRHLMFTIEADNRIFKPDLDEVSYGWTRRFWPSIMENSMKLLQRYPSLETLTVPLTPPSYGVAWRPAFFAVKFKTRAQRVALAAQWLKPRCPWKDEKLHACLMLRLPAVSNEDLKESNWDSNEVDATCWDSSEFEDAFQLMKSFP